MVELFNFPTTVSEMVEQELVKMSEKGQLVVPRRIRKKEGFRGSDRFVAIEVEDGVLFKRVEIPDVEIEFEALSRDISSHFKKHKIKQSDVAEAVKWQEDKSDLRHQHTCLNPRLPNGRSRSLFATASRIKRGFGPCAATRCSSKQMALVFLS
jgi:bifunctional DNA-binding transcriptional regulator/antitoxin component of YhaV-PrlF toxin-antitoxin module